MTLVAQAHKNPVNNTDGGQNCHKLGPMLPALRANKNGHAQYGKSTMQAKEWIEATFTRLFHNNVDDVIRGLKIMQPASPEAQEKIAEVIRYLSKRKDQVNYGSAKRAGYQLGSGAIESANKFIGHVRLKRSGAWWYITNANNILKLRCAKYNGTYDSIILKYIAQDRKKQYEISSIK